MHKEILPHKLIFNFNEDNNFAKGIFMYKIVSASGEVSRNYKTININSEINIPAINGMINKIIAFVKKQEGVDND